MLILLDRDGVLNEERRDYVKSVDEIVLLPGAAEAVAVLNRAGHHVVVVSNQSAVGRGMISQAQLDEIMAALVRRLERTGARLDAVLFCTDPPWAATDRRKPGPGMLIEAMARFDTPAHDTIMIGDSLRDLQAAVRAGCRRALVRTGNGRDTEAKGLPADILPCPIYDDLAAFARALGPAS
ncbi:MAG: HAD-IIIA family hydrolase [Alphaproteobacteria bacterium]|nr:HAD-IIIA family hydrolase [Alphaproteobacteria bacterium]